MNKEECLFCKIIAGQMETKMVLETEDFVVFKDIHPQAPVHVLVVPRKHYNNVNDIAKTDFESMGKVFEVVQKAVEKLGISQAYQLRVNNGEEAGQVINHLHIHIMGGWKNKQLG